MDQYIPWDEVDSDEQEFLDWLRKVNQQKTDDKLADIRNDMVTLFECSIDGIWVDSDDTT